MARGSVRFYTGRGLRHASVRLVRAEVISSYGDVIWSDNTGAKGWAHLSHEAHKIAAAATILENKGQMLEPWDLIVDRARLS